jgi:hypothetical protein
MLEIIFLVWFCRKLAAIAQSKGRSGGWAAFGALFWVGGEVFGFVAGSLMHLDLGAYLVAILGAGLGAVVAWLLVNSLGETVTQKVEPGVVWSREIAK